MVYPARYMSVHEKGHWQESLWLTLFGIPQCAVGGPEHGLQTPMWNQVFFTPLSRHF